MSSASRRTILKPIALGSATPERPSGGPAALLSPGAASILMQPGSGPPKFHGHQLSAEGAASSGTEALQGVPMRLPHVDSHSHSREEVQHHQPGTANNRILDNMPIASSSEVARSPFRPSDAPPSHASPVRRLSFKSSQTEGNAASTTADVNEARMQTTTAITVVPMAPATAQRVGAKGSYPQAAASAAVSLGKPLNTRDPIAPAPSHAHKPSRPHPGASKSLSRKNDTIVQPVQPGIQQPSAALRAVQAAQIDSSSESTITVRYLTMPYFVNVILSCSRTSIDV